MRPNGRTCLEEFSLHDRKCKGLWNVAGASRQKAEGPSGTAPLFQYAGLRLLFTTFYQHLDEGLIPLTRSTFSNELQHGVVKCVGSNNYLPLHALASVFSAKEAYGPSAGHTRILEVVMSIRENDSGSLADPIQERERKRARWLQSQ